MTDPLKNIEKIVEMLGSGAAVLRQTDSGVYAVSVAPSANDPSVDITIVPSDPEYGIIHVKSDIVKFFPGYRTQFVLDTKVKPYVMHLTGSSKGTVEGALKGGYICHPREGKVDPRFLALVPDADARSGSFRTFFEATKIVPGKTVRIYKCAPDFYRLDEVV